MPAGYPTQDQQQQLAALIAGPQRITCHAAQYASNVLPEQELKQDH